MAISFEKTGKGASILGHIGSVEHVIAGNLPPEITSRRYRASDFTCGFELATPENINSMGEAVIVNGLCFTNSTDHTSKQYTQSISGKEFTAGGVFLIPHTAHPSHLLTIDDCVSMPHCYQTIHSNIPEPLAFAGIFHFSHFHGAAIGKPPIHGDNIFTHQKEYYPNPDIHLENTWGFVVGVLSDWKGPEEFNNQLKTVLYKNPMDVDGPFIHHAHVLILNQKITSVEEILPSTVDLVLHLFMDGTSILSGKAEIFTIKEIQNYLLKGAKTDERR
jgi:hypothetical protein